MTPLRRPMWRTLPTAPRRPALGRPCPLLAACCAAARCGGAAPDDPACACLASRSCVASEVAPWALIDSFYDSARDRTTFSLSCPNLTDQLLSCC